MKHKTKRMISLLFSLFICHLGNAQIQQLNIKNSNNIGTEILFCRCICSGVYDTKLSGKNVTWKYLNLCQADMNETNSYQICGDSIIVERVNGLLYFYTLKNRALYLTDYISDNKRIKYGIPILYRIYSDKLNIKRTEKFDGKGKINGNDNLFEKGKVSLQIDASGTLILEKDTFRNVVRIKTKKKYFVTGDHNMNHGMVQFQWNNNFYEVFENIKIEEESYKWYSLKDPLPIFEIIEQKIYKKNGMQYKRSNAIIYYKK
jgi:hypothetical protein